MIEIDNLNQLGHALKRARTMAGLSVQTLAEKLGYDPGVLEMKEAWGYPGLTISEADQSLRACGLSLKAVITLPVKANQKCTCECEYECGCV